MLVIDWTAYGERVHAARRRRRLTQDDLSRLIGVARNTISAIELGATTPSYAIVLSLCEALDIAEPETVTVERGEI